MKRALVLSGGGSKGAYQAGVLKHILGESKIKYDVYCGVSVGALNAAFLAMYANGQEVQASESLLQIWQTIRTKDVRKGWFPFGKLHALWKPSVYNSAPLIKLVRERLDVDAIRASGKELAVGAASLTTGDYRVFTHDYHDVAGAVLASSAFPAMLCPVKLDDELWTDGGVRDVTPIKAAIDLGAEKIDVVMCSPKDNDGTMDDDSPSTITVAKRSISILSDEVLENDIRVANLISELALVGRMKDKKQIQIRVLRPSVPLPGDSLDFDREDLDKKIEIGYDDAQKLSWK